MSVEILEWDGVPLRTVNRASRRKKRRDLRTVDAIHRADLDSLPSAKQFQRTFRDKTRDFIKEKRRDLTKIHVMYWEEVDGLMELDFASSDALREALPDLVGEGAEIVTIGKPLPVV